MIMRAPAGNTKNMGPHHSGTYWPLFSHCPGLLVAVPAFGHDAKGLMKDPIHLRIVTRDGRVGIFINGVLRTVMDDPFPGEEGRPGLYTEASSIATSFKATRFSP